MNEAFILKVIFVNLPENSSMLINDTPGRLDIYTTRNSCHERYVSKINPVFLPADEEASWSLLPTSSISLLIGGIVTPENTYTYILKGTG